MPKKRLSRPAQLVLEPDQISLERSDDEEEENVFSEQSQISIANGSLNISSQRTPYFGKHIITISEKSSTALNEIE